MATKKVNIDLVAKDKTRQAMQSATKGVDGVKNSVLNLKNALIGLGAGVAIKGFVDVGKSVESLQVRLKFLFGSVEEGAKAFDAMAKFAGKVPFSLGEIQSGAGVLAVVSKDANELSKVLELTGNVAAVTGLDFRTTAEQIQRSLSAGISSADLFREKGVKSMLGFSAGATVSVEQTREALFRVFGKGGEFAGATSDLANTLEGTLSMIGDKFFNFQKTVAEEFFVALKKEFGALDETLAANEELITSIAQKVGKGLANAVTASSNAIKFLNDNAQLLTATLKFFIALKLIIFFRNLAASIDLAKISMVSFNKAVKKNLLIGGLALVISQLDLFIAKIKELRGIEDIEDQLKPGLKLMTVIDAFGNEIKIVVKDLEHASNIIDIGMLPPIKEAETKFQKIVRHIKETAGKLGELNKDALEKAKEKFKNIGDTVAKGINEGITKTSEALARSVILGENLAQTFKKMAQELAVKVLSAIIEIVARKGVELAIEKLITKEKQKQAAISKASTFSRGLSFIGSFLGFADGGRPPVGRPSIVGERGPELFVPDQAGTVVPNNQLGMSKAVTVNFNINTVDARGFNELLVNSRGVIVNMINTAVNEKGKAALI
jgi:hypothetical protein